MAAVSGPTVISIAVTVTAGTAAAILINLFTDSPGLALGGLVLTVVITQMAILYVNEVLRQRTAGIDRGVLLTALASMMPFSRRSRSRAEAIRVLRADLGAKRRTRLRALVPGARLDDVLEWMRSTTESAVEVPAGQLRVLVAPMGSGKTEKAMRWIEQGIDSATVDARIEVPIWLGAREAVDGLQGAIHSWLGRDANRPCRVVLDDLDGIGFNEAERLLDEARQLVDVWPNLSVLATSRPGVDVTDKELLTIAPWDVERGVDLARHALGRNLPYGVWSRETEALFTGPLLALAMAKRIDAGGASPTSTC